MAGGLRSSPRRRFWLPALLALPVLLLHLWLGEQVTQLQQDWGAVAPMPPRMTVSYVRELQQAPAPAARRTAPPPPPPQSPAPGMPAEPVAAVTPEPPASAPPAALMPEPVEVLAAEAPVLAAAPASAPDSAPASAPASAVAASEPGPEWPLSTKLSYGLTGNYRGAVTGHAQVEWLRDGWHYQVHLDLQIGPSFAPLIARRMSSDGQLTASGIEPQRYDEDTRVLFSARRRVSVLFQGAQLQLADGRVEQRLPGAQDAASQFVQLTWLFLTGREKLAVGRVVELPLVLPRRQYRWRYEVLGEETLQTPMGPLDTWHLKPSREAGGGDLTAEVWLAPSLQYLPVRLRIHQDAQTFIDLLLNAPPLQAAAP